MKRRPKHCEAMMCKEGWKRLVHGRKLCEKHAAIYKADPTAVDFE